MQVLDAQSHSQQAGRWRDAETCTAARSAQPAAAQRWERPGRSLSARDWANAAQLRRADRGAKWKSEAKATRVSDPHENGSGLFGQLLGQAAATGKFLGSSAGCVHADLGSWTGSRCPGLQHA